MEQEFEFFDPAPQNVRRQLLFMTPLKRKTFLSQKDSELQNTPKAKTSKPKITTNRPTKKIQIDFGVQSNYFLNEPASVEKSKEEEEEEQDSIFADEHQVGVFGLAKSPGDWYFESPMMTAVKPKNTSYEGLNDYTKEPKQKKAGEESPFCKLLNESDKYSVKTYQTLDGISEQDEEDDFLREKYMEEIKALEKFFKCFADRSLNILSFFVAEPVFEVIGEEKVYPLNTTLNALAKAFLRFECPRGQVDYEYKYGYSSDGSEVILTTGGRLIAEEAQSEFVLSAKILIKERLINHAKLKIM